MVLTLNTEKKSWRRDTEVVRNGNTDEIAEYVSGYHRPWVFIEDYVERGTSFKTNNPMRQMINDLRAGIPGAAVLSNLGVKKVVKPALMQLLDVWDFDTKTRHQDLRSAARIGLFGALRNVYLNEVLTEFLADHLKGRSWSVEQTK